MKLYQIIWMGFLAEEAVKKALFLAKQRFSELVQLKLSNDTLEEDSAPTKVGNVTPICRSGGLESG